MKHNVRIILVVALLLLLTGMILLAVFPKNNSSALEIRAAAYSRDTNGNETVSLVVTNRSLEVWPHFAAVETPQGDLPLYDIEIKSEEGWNRAANPINYLFAHSLRLMSS